MIFYHVQRGLICLQRSGDPRVTPGTNYDRMRKLATQSFILQKIIDYSKKTLKPESFKLPQDNVSKLRALKFGNIVAPLVTKILKEL